MIRELHETSEDKDDVRKWSLFILLKGQQPNYELSPLKQGYWFSGRDGCEPAGERLYREQLREARAEVERLNRLDQALHR